MKLADWRPGHPITLVIGAEVWEGVLYRANGLLWIYVVGELPATWSPHDKCQFNIDGHIFHVTCYMDRVDELSPEIQNKYHPFGNSWILKRVNDTTYPVVEGTIE